MFFEAHMRHHSFTLIFFLKIKIKSKCVIFTWTITNMYNCIYYKEFNCGGLTVQNNFAHMTNQNILNYHIN